MWRGRHIFEPLPERNGAATLRSRPLQAEHQPPHGGAAWQSSIVRSRACLGDVPPKPIGPVCPLRTGALMAKCAPIAVPSPVCASELEPWRVGIPYPEATRLAATSAGCRPCCREAGRAHLDQNCQRLWEQTHRASRREIQAASRGPGKCLSRTPTTDLPRYGLSGGPPPPPIDRATGVPWGPTFEASRSRVLNCCDQMD